MFNTGLKVYYLREVFIQTLKIKKASRNWWWMCACLCGWVCSGNIQLQACGLGDVCKHGKHSHYMSCNMHVVYFPQSPTNDKGNRICISFNTSPFYRLMLFPIAYFKTSNDILLSSWKNFRELLTNVKPCLVVMMAPS